MLFLIALGITWVCSWRLSGTGIEIPKAGGETEMLQVQDQLTGTALVTFLSNMVAKFVTFPPLGVVLVAMLGLGVARSRPEHPNATRARVPSRVVRPPTRRTTGSLAG